MKHKKAQIWVRVTESGKFPLNTCDERVRIIYEDGESEYSSGHLLDAWWTPCWNLELEGDCFAKLAESSKEAVKLMKAYDEKYGFKTVKICED